MPKSNPRYLSPQIAQDIQRKMVFVSGPRQVGKTTLAKQFLPPHSDGYLNWDIPAHREHILKRHLPPSKLWIFDEIHKYSAWRNYLKGLYDEYGSTHHILVTGSAQLDCYRRGGDSLQGRYHALRLYPLSAAELKLSTLNELFTLGGFPEPFFTGSELEAKRWSKEYRHRLIEEDIIKLEQIRDLGRLELLMLRLPELVGSPLSINALREDLQVSHGTVTNWLDVFTRLYAIFRLSPFGQAPLRAIKKAQKHYHFDWSLVQLPGLRFENMIAVHLLKWVHFEEDTKARNLCLSYFRDVDGREVDFIVTEDGKPILAVECKLGDADVGKGLKYFKHRFPTCEAWQLSLEGSQYYLSKEGIHVAPALELLNQLV